MGLPSIVIENEFPSSRKKKIVFANIKVKKAFLETVNKNDLFVFCLFEVGV
jgi:hypothetical protein